MLIDTVHFKNTNGRWHLELFMSSHYFTFFSCRLPLKVWQWEAWKWFPSQTTHLCHTMDAAHAKPEGCDLWTKMCCKSCCCHCWIIKCFFPYSCCRSSVLTMNYLWVKLDCGNDELRTGVCVCVCSFCWGLWHFHKSSVSPQSRGWCSLVQWCWQKQNEVYIQETHTDTFLCFVRTIHRTALRFPTSSNPYYNSNSN